MKRLLAFTTVLLLTACSQQQTGTQSSSSSSAGSSSSAIAYTGPLPDFDKTYVNNAANYSIKYPSDFPIKTQTDVITNNYSVSGTAFFFPSSYAPNTTLNEAEIHVGTDVTCPTLDQEEHVTVNNFPFTRSPWQGVAAGNLYEGETYTTYRNNQCYILTLYIHSCNLGPDCSPGHTKTFARLPMKALFEKMVGTFTFLK